MGDSCLDQLLNDNDDSTNLNFQARILPPNARGGRTENCAERVSRMIPFILYDLHRQLLLKMRVMQVNTAWSLFTQIQIGERLIVGLIRATGVLNPALPLPLIEIDEDEDLSGNYKSGGNMDSDMKSKLGLLKEQINASHAKIWPQYEQYYQPSSRSFHSVQQRSSIDSAQHVDQLRPKTAIEIITGQQDDVTTTKLNIPLGNTLFFLPLVSFNYIYIAN